jgi:Luciferase-like monooxygenase
VAGGARAFRVHVGRARRGGAGHRPAAAHDHGHLLYVPLPPRGGRPEGRHGRGAVRRTVHPRPGRGREPQRACDRHGLARGPGPHERLEEAAQIIRALFTGGYVNFSGCHFEVERAKLYDLPDSPVPIGIAVSGAESVELAAEYADCMIATEPDGSLVSGFEESGGPASRSKGRWRSATTLTRPPRGTAPASCGGGPPAAGGTSCPSYPIPGRSRPSPARSARTRLPSSWPCGPDIGQHVAAARKFTEAGFTHLALLQVGSDQQDQSERADWNQGC